ncbi:phosphate ABC transporter, periplasmic phosphate-binding protein [[Synechococcus] sp. NIES-970]|uniref:phosphate ABC transporter substrate-binding protein PstS n=1 Tax=Picosynechococcus sp. NKBG15041c TaxID=1407650 RepID=UPI00041F5C80|nr:phosphate ABC transporter substrate-binding protein PstS [Picosynechococcus sp. NKBG15041c]BAW95322.1 phosphate ABC transporter, periplasmic phosphate-binding protein [[Synechococcus] sp. NIES-970]
MPLKLSLNQSLFFTMALTGLCSGLSSCGGLLASKEPMGIEGAGASFPAPLYQRWITEFDKQAKVSVKYDSVGSGEGVRKYLSQEVDFGATDAPLNTEEIEQFPDARGPIIQVPLTGGLLVFAYNLGNFEGTENIRLSRESYCGIVTGQIRNWNDPKIVADNPNVRMPNLPIIFVHRSDGSGTTFIFSSHITAACPEWTGGAAKEVDWPENFLGAPGNEGVTAQIQQSQGGIGYIEYSYARSNRLPMAIIQNKTGAFINPTSENAAKAFSGINVPSDFALSIPDPSQPEAYPIVGLTWLLIYGQYDDANTIKGLKEFVTWTLTKGDSYAEELGYIPIPNDLEQRVLEVMKNL